MAEPRESPEHDFAAECGAPRRYHGMFRSNFPKDWPTVLPSPWLGDRPRQWAVALIGGVGTAKTHLATAIINESCAHWREVHDRLTSGTDEASAMARARNPQPLAALWWDSRELVQTVLDELGQRENRTWSRDRACRYPGIVLLDDLGAEREKDDFARGLLSYVISQRYNRVLPTIITSNADEIEDLDAIDPRTASRLGYNAAIVLHLGDLDWRMEDRNDDTGQED